MGIAHATRLAPMIDYSVAQVTIEKPIPPRETPMKLELKYCSM
ncbi:MAG: hypothetical protein SNJ82_09290 [Gemmataceae bacterium]